MSARSARSKRSAPWGGRPRVKEPKTKRLAVRCTPRQFSIMDAAATRAGLSLGAFSRAVLLGDPGPRAVRRPPVEKAMLARLLGAIGKVGSNINQISHHANAARSAPALHELRLIRRDLAQMRAATLNALGMRS